MSLFHITSEIIITCHNRLAPYLSKEVGDLGFELLETFATGVRLEGTLADCIKLNLNLRCASQVLFKLDEFDAYDANDLYDNVLQISWENLIPEDTYISITSNVFNDTINNSMFANLRVKDAIVDRLREEWGERPDTGSSLEGAVVHLHWKNEEASIFLDTSGHSLGRHGYRKIPGQAPMLEALAAATILASNWDRKTSFVNPMCGSGTLAIEAALMAKNITPGYFRNNYAFMYLMGYDPEIYQKEKDALHAQIIEHPKVTIIASDYSRLAIANSQKNAQAAGVANLITFEVCDFADTTIPAEDKGVVFMNPEYGDRLGEEQELEETYARIGDFMKQKCKGYTGYIFTGNMALAKKVGLKASRRIEFYNSKIDCRLLAYDLYDGSKKAAPAPTN